MLGWLADAAGARESNSVAAHCFLTADESQDGVAGYVDDDEM